MDIEALKALQRYHRGECKAYRYPGVGRCDCGLDAILAASQPAQDELADARAKLAAVGNLAKAWDEQARQYRFETLGVASERKWHIATGLTAAAAELRAALAATPDRG